MKNGVVLVALILLSLFFAGAASAASCKNEQVGCMSYQAGFFEDTKDPAERHPLITSRIAGQQSYADDLASRMFSAADRGEQGIRFWNGCVPVAIYVYHVNQSVDGRLAAYDRRSRIDLVPAPNLPEINTVGEGPADLKFLVSACGGALGFAAAESWHVPGQTRIVFDPQVYTLAPSESASVPGCIEFTPKGIAMMFYDYREGARSPWSPYIDPALRARLDQAKKRKWTWGIASAVLPFGGQQVTSLD